MKQVVKVGVKKLNIKYLKTHRVFHNDYNNKHTDDNTHLLQENEHTTHGQILSTWKTTKT
jgi:hypothetical protein